MAADRSIPDTERTMTMMEHLRELRQRLIYCCLALAGGLLVSALPIPGRSSVAWTVMEFLLAPTDFKLQAIQPGETFITYMKVSLLTGAALALPVIIYQILMFVLPALLPHEKKYLYMAMPGVAICFALGVLFGYLALVPFAVKFLASFGSELIQQQWTVGAYLSFVTTILFWMGVSFETPLIIFFLAKMRVVSYPRLAQFRRYALLLAFVVAAIITPTPDPLNQTLVGVPLYLLYEIGAQMARFA